MSERIEISAQLEPGCESERLLASDHAVLDQAFDALILAIEANDPGESFTQLDLLWAHLGMHIRAEHLCLFPALLCGFTDEVETPEDAPDRDTVRFAILGLRSDHEFFMHGIARAIGILREAQVSNSNQANDWQAVVREIIISIRRRLEIHNVEEETKVYPWASVVLSESEQMRLAARIRNELANLPSRFREH